MDEKDQKKKQMLIILTISFLIASSKQQNEIKDKYLQRNYVGSSQFLSVLRQS